MNTIRHSLLAACAATLTLLATPALAAPGDLDSTFGTGGIVTTAFSGSAQAVAIQSDGTILAAGRSDNQFTVARLLPTGALDPSFGTGGKVSTAVGTSTNNANAMALMSGGRVVVAGAASNGGNSGFGVARVLATGALDTSFNSTGKVFTDVGGGGGGANAVAVQSDGKIVVAGHYSTISSAYDIVLVRYREDGSLDPDFGSSGMVFTSLSSSNDQARAVTIQPGGDILIAGNTNGNWFVARYLPTGALDGSFGTGGITVTDFGGDDIAYAMTLQSDGKIVLAGGANSAGNQNFAAARYLSTGALDSTFGTSGTVETSFGGGVDVAQAVAVQVDGSVLLAGFAPGTGINDFALLRYTSTGTLDTAFGTSGKVTTDFGSDDASSAIGLGSEGRILVAGQTGASSAWALARYEGTPPLLVTTTADSGTGSLRQALANAAVIPGGDTITLDASLSGQTITFASEVVVSDVDGVTVDASALAGGLTLSGNNANRIFTVAAGGNLTLIGVTLINGTGAGTSPDGQGGALLIQSTGTATIERCTLSGNHCASGFGGAIRNEGSLIMTFSTLSGNSSPNEGGAYFGAGGTATVTHCTISGNNAGTRGGGMRLAGGSAATNFTIVAGNTRAGSLTHVEANHAGTPLTGGTNLISSTPLLDALASNGGPTQTMALQAGSAAIDAAVGSTATEDQRGEFLYGTADIGAYEYKGGIYLVTNNADSGAGSLRQTLADAAAASGADTIEFAASLSGGTITTASEILVDDADGVTVDGSSLATPVTIDGGTGTNRLIKLNPSRSLTLIGLAFSNGHGGTSDAGRGGAINSNGTLTLTRCTFTSNSAAAGGAVRNTGSLNATDCTFANNTSPNQGGAIHSPGSMTLTRCTFTGNSADEGGATYGNSATVTQCTFSGNTGRSGAAIIFFSTMGLTHSTVWGNIVSPPGGTAVSNRSAGGTLTLTNSIVEDIMNFGTFTRVGANLVATLINTGGTGTDSGPAAITDDPLLGALASNGGPTQTRALLAGSPAIDAAVGSAATVDQRGQAIVGTADLGAYEHPQTAQTINFTNPGGHTYGDAPFALSATATSGLTVSFAIVSGPATVLGDMLTITGAGDVTVRASQAGDGTYYAAADVDQTFTVAKAPQTITFPPIADRTYGDAPFAVNATSSSGETVGFLMIEGYSGIAMFDNGFAGGTAGQNVVINGAGHVTIRASVPESANYLAAPDVEQGFTIMQVGQAITFNPPATATTADTIVLSATGGASGYPVVFSVQSGPGTISGGNNLSFTGPGSVVVRASQVGDANFAAAPDVDRTIAVSPSLILLDDKGYASKGVVYFDVIANDTSTSGAVVLQSVTQPVGGNAKTKIEGGRVRFTPVSTVTGTLTFTYTASNGFDTSTATVTVRPFSVAVGTYVGLMKRPDDTVRGRVVITTTALGQLTGQLRYEGRSHVLKGGVNWTGELAVTGTQPLPKPALLVRGEDDALGQPTFILTVPDSIVGQKLTGTAERSPYTASNPTAQAGKYTIVSELSSGGTGPALAGMMTCSVTSAGTVKFGGKTGNGVTVVQAGKLLNGGRLPFFVSTGIGAAMQGLSGELVFDLSGTPDVTGTLRWRVPAGTVRLAAGVDEDYDTTGLTYTPAANAVAMFNPSATSATITLEIPSLGAGSPVVRTLTLTGAPTSGKQRVYLPTAGGGGGYVNFTVASGLFSGVRTLGSTSKNFTGVVLQGGGINTGHGMILDTAALGEVTIAP